MADKVKRNQIVALKTAGGSNNDIVKQLKVSWRFTMQENNFKSEAQPLVSQFQAESAQFAPKMWLLQWRRR